MTMKRFAFCAIAALCAVPVLLALASSAWAADGLVAAGAAPAFPIVSTAMSMMAAMPRSVVRLRAEGDAVKIFNELKMTFEAFKAERDKEIADIKAKLGDVVQSEKVDRINAEITALTKALDDVNKVTASLRAGGMGGKDGDPAKAEHRTAFHAFFRKGVEANLRDLEVKAALSTQSNPDGGYVVPTEMEQQITRVLGIASVLRQRSRVISISTNEYKRLVNVGGAGSGWVGETESRPATATPGLKELIFSVMEMYANPQATQNLLDDAAVDIEAWLADEVQITFAEAEGAAFVSGNGVRKPRGILSYDTVANASYAWGSLGYVVTGNASAFASSNPADALIDLFYALKAGYRTNASWIMSDAVLNTVRKMKDGDGTYLWNPPTGAGEVPTILQKPVDTDDNMPGLGANAFPVAFGDFRQGYLIVDRQGTRVLRDPFTNKPYVGFYTTKRVGGGVQNFEAIKLLKCST